MPGERPETAGSRGPVRREPALSPSGYRISERRRFELQAAILYTGVAGLQGIIDLAVTEFLDRMRIEPGFNETLDHAERSQRRRAGVRQLPGATP
jgi:hypothetical protein